MYSRNVTVMVDPTKLDAVIRNWNEQIPPAVRQMHCFRGARLLVERRTGKLRSQGLWETEADMQATAQWNQDVLDRLVDLFTAAPVVEEFEVAVEVLPVIETDEEQRREILRR